MNKVPKPNPPHCTYCHQIGHQINECPFIEDNARKRFVEHFQNLNPKLAEDHGDFELKDLYHEKVKIPDIFIRYIWKNNRMEMRVQTLLNVIPIYVAHASNMFHHNNVGITYVRTSNFRVEQVRSIPLYSVVMPHSMVIVIEAPFSTTQTHTIIGMRSKPQTPRGINLLNMHTKMSKGLDKIFVKQSLDTRGGGSKPA